MYNTKESRKFVPIFFFWGGGFVKLVVPWVLSRVIRVSQGNGCDACYTCMSITSSHHSLSSFCIFPFMKIVATC